STCCGTPLSTISKSAGARPRIGRPLSMTSTSTRTDSTRAANAGCCEAASLAAPDQARRATKGTKEERTEVAMATSRAAVSRPTSVTLPRSSSASFVVLCALVRRTRRLLRATPSEGRAQFVEQRTSVSRLRDLVHPPGVLARFVADWRQRVEPFHGGERAGAIAAAPRQLTQRNQRCMRARAAGCG